MVGEPFTERKRKHSLVDTNSPAVLLGGLIFYKMGENMKKFLSGVLGIFILLISASTVFAETVVFNWKTLKYHKPGCQWAQKCTQNCTSVDKKTAIKNGGRPCKVCGG